MLLFVDFFRQKIDKISVDEIICKYNKKHINSQKIIPSRHAVRHYFREIHQLIIPPYTSSEILSCAQPFPILPSPCRLQTRKDEEYPRNVIILFYRHYNQLYYRRPFLQISHEVLCNDEL